MNRLGIIIVVYNNADLICRQIECIRMFCQDVHDIVIIDNSDMPGCSKHVEYYANINKCTYLKTNASSSNSSESHVFACNLAYLKLKDTYKYFFFLDHDNFPVKHFSVTSILGERIIAGLGQVKTSVKCPEGKKYFWPGCLMWDNSRIDKTLIDFSTNMELGLDTGGNLYRVVEHYGEDACVFFNEAYEQNPYFRKSAYDHYSMINDGMFMHFVNASNWNNSSDNTERINSLINVLHVKVEPFLNKASEEEKS